MPKLTMTPERDTLELSLSGLDGPDFQKGLVLAKSLPGRRFNGDKKVWEVPADPEIAEKIMVALRPSADPEVLSWIKATQAERQQQLITPLDDDAEVFVPWRDRLYDFQRAFVAHAAERPRLILADDMGLGKTFQAISAQAEWAIREKHPDGPKLVVCPNSVKGVWARELRKWLGPDTPLAVIQGTAKQRLAQMQEAIKQNGWVIVNWEQIRVKQEEYEKTTISTLPDGSKRKTKRKASRTVMREPLLASTPWVSVFADEAHRAKNRKSLQARGLWKIDAPFKLALSGTPLMNSPDELWSILRWLYPDQYHEQGEKHAPGAMAYWPFFDTYVDYYEGYFNNKVITGVKNPDALRFELSDKLVRRTKGDKLDLPPKVREHVPVTMSPAQAKLYKEAEKAMWLEIENAAKEGDTEAQRIANQIAAGRSLFDIPNGAVRTTRLRQILSTPACLGGEDVSAKLDAAVEIITDAQPKQFVVFSEYVTTCEALVRRLTRPRPHGPGLIAKSFIGDISAETRTKLEDDFQDGKIDVLVGTTGAMGEGVTLTAADTVIFIERPWVPAKADQAEDRLWRNGQENRVTVLILEVPDTVDTNKVTPTLAIKSGIVASVIQQDPVEVRQKGDS